MRRTYDETDILDRDVLRKIGAAINVRYVFQLRLAAFTQTMTDRIKIQPLDLRVLQTRSSILRLSLQLWDTKSGELLWGSGAETTMANEAMSQAPVYFEDIARATLGGMMADLLNRKTSSQYTPMNTFLNGLIQEDMPKSKTAEEEKAANEPAK